MELLKKIGSSRLALSTVILAVLVLAACKKNDDYVQPAAAGLMAFNLTADQSSVGIALSGNQWGNGSLGYSEYTGQYLPVYTGTRELRSYDNFSGTTLDISNQEFKDSLYYSAFVVGDSGVYRNVIVNDDYTMVTPVSGKAWVRYVNAVADTMAMPMVNIGEHSETAAFGHVSAFEAVNAGDLAVAISGAAGIDASRTITVEENKIYTVLLIGKPNATDTAKAVSIRFIQNGNAAN